MTTYEHVMVGVCGALAVGLQRRHGWPIVAWAGAAATLPDWDGLTFFLGPQCFAAGHRFWGHNLLVAGVLAALASAAVYHWDMLPRLQQRLARRWPLFATAAAPPTPHNAAELALWLVVGIAAAYSHLLVDVAFSGSRYLPAWGVPLLWPFCDKEWTRPLVSWGDVGPTLIFAAAMFAMLRWRRRIQLIAIGTLLAEVGYMAVCGWLR